MQKTAAKPPANDLYETDFYAWTQEQAKLLHDRRWHDLDLTNLVDEVGSVGGSEKREIRNRLVSLLAHLLKWKFQPGRRGSSWRRTIRDHRKQLMAIVEDSPSLKGYLEAQIADRYEGAILEASEETGIAVVLFPEQCPFTSQEVFDLEFLPEDRSIE